MVNLKKCKGFDKPICNCCARLDKNEKDTLIKELYYSSITKHECCENHIYKRLKR